MQLDDSHRKLIGYALDQIPTWEDAKDRTVEDLLCMVQDQWFNQFIEHGHTLTPEDRWQAYLHIHEVDVMTGNTRAATLLSQFYGDKLPDPPAAS